MKENKMGVMPVNKLLITMAAPMVLSMLIGALNNVVDSLFVSHYGEMGRTPPWAEGLILRADGYCTQFYKKD